MLVSFLHKCTVPRLISYLVENLENPFADVAFKDPSKKLAARLQASAKEEEKEEKEEKVCAFRMPRNLPTDILCSSQEDQGPEFKMPRNLSSDILCPSQEDQDPEFKIPKALPLSPISKFKMPRSFPLEKHGTRNVSDIARDVLNGKGDLLKILDDSDTILSNGSSSKPSATTEVSNLSDSSPLSSPPGSPAIISSHETQDGFTRKRDVFTDTLAARCPMCREAVDVEFLNSFDNGRRMNVRKQLARGQSAPPIG